MSFIPLSVLTDDQNRRIVYTVRTLLADPDINRERLAAARFVNGILKARLNERIGFTDELINEFIAVGEGEDKILSATTENGLLSQDKLRDFCRLLKTAKKDTGGGINPSSYRRAAVDLFYGHVLWKEGIAFRKAAGIDNKVWDSFTGGKARCEDSTIDKIIDTLGLVGEDADGLRRLIHKKSIPVNRGIREKVYAGVTEYNERNKSTITEFLEFALVTQKEWEKFSGPPDRTNTSQGTLLKLSTGFGHSRPAAEEFLRAANSRFAFKTDLVFLAAILCDTYTPDNLICLFNDIFTDCPSPYRD